MRFRLGDRVERNNSAMPNCAAVGCTHFRVPMADEFQKPLLISTGRSFSTGELRACGSCFGQWFYGPPGLCDRESSSSRPLARHLETCRQPNGGVWRPCPNQRNKSDRKENTRQPQLCSMPVRCVTRTNRKDDALFPRPPSLDLAAGTVTIGMQADEARGWCEPGPSRRGVRELRASAIARMAAADAAYGSGRMRERRDDREQDVETMGLQRALPFFLAPVHGCHDPGRYDHVEERNGLLEPGNARQGCHPGLHLGRSEEDRDPRLEDRAGRR